MRHEVEGSSSLVLINKKERVNGWSWPPHPFQLVAWFFVVSLPIAYYGVLVPHLPSNWIPAGCIIPGSFLFVHVIFHLVCLSLDPADPKIRQSKTTKATEFNRTQHKHVIENDHCYICQVDVGKRSKHCSLCNKCISEFDHHCKWLNNCIGGQNYKLFFGCLTTAMATALTLLAFCLYLFIMYFKNRETVMNQPAWRLFGDLNNKTFISATGVMILLLLIAIVLLGHLLSFHIFLMLKGLSTYDYIVQARQASPNISTYTESVVVPPKIQPLRGNKISPLDTKDNAGTESIQMTNGTVQQDYKIDFPTKTS